MQARLTAHPPAQAAFVRSIRPGEVLRIGRAADCGLRLEHPSVSRAHAELDFDGDAWRVRDLESKNGTFVDGEPVVGESALRRAPGKRAWLRFGDVHCEFAALDAREADAADAGLRARRDAATAHTARIVGLDRLDDWLDASLRGVLELAQCERGFVLLRDGDGFAVRAGLAFDAAALRDRGFSGSIGAVRRALDERRTVIVNDIGGDAGLRDRASVVASGISALACLPLHDGALTLGAIYADRVRIGPPITTLDQELLEAFAERAALWIAARRATALLDAGGVAGPALVPARDWDGIVAGHGDMLR